LAEVVADSAAEVKGARAVPEAPAVLAEVKAEQMAMLLEWAKKDLRLRDFVPFLLHIRQLREPRRPQRLKQESW